MGNQHNLAGISALAWAILALAGFALNIALAALGRLDIYDSETALRFLEQRPALVIGSHFFYGLAGVAFVLTAIAFYEWLPREGGGYLARASLTFGIIAGTLFFISGQIGGWGGVDLRYVQATRSADYAQAAYLPLAIVVNRMFAAAITGSGLWLLMTNLNIVKNKILPAVIAYLGLGAGILALSGLLLPGGGLGLLGFLLGTIWGILAGLLLLRQSL